MSLELPSQLSNVRMDQSCTGRGGGSLQRMSVCDIGVRSYCIGDVTSYRVGFLHSCGVSFDTGSGCVDSRLSRPTRSLSSLPVTPTETGGCSSSMIDDSGRRVVQVSRQRPRG